MDERLRLTEKQQKDLEKLQSALKKLEDDNVGLILWNGGFICAVNMKSVEKLSYWDSRPDANEECIDDKPGVILITKLTLDDDESWFKVKYKND